jgi:hypothetical protein
VSDVGRNRRILMGNTDLSSETICTLIEGQPIHHRLDGPIEIVRQGVRTLMFMTYEFRSAGNVTITRRGDR